MVWSAIVIISAIIPVCLRSEQMKGVFNRSSGVGCQTVVVVWQRHNDVYDLHSLENTLEWDGSEVICVWRVLPAVKFMTDVTSLNNLSSCAGSPAYYFRYVSCEGFLLTVLFQKLLGETQEKQMYVQNVQN